MINQNLNEAVGFLIQSKADENNYELKDNQFRISTLAYCSRRIFYDKTCPDKQEYDIYAKGRFLIGTILHEYLEKHLALENAVIESKVSYYYKDIELIGHPDIVVEDRVIDIKTCSNSSFYYRKNDSFPAYHHFYQVNCYANILEKDTVSILYINKETFEPLERTLPAEGPRFKSALEKAHTIYQAILKKKIPDCDPEEGWECKYCPYSELCYLEDEL